LCLGTCYGRTEIKRQKKKQQKLIRRKEAQDQVWTKKVSLSEEQIDAVFKSRLIEEKYHSKH